MKLENIQKEVLYKALEGIENVHCFIIHLA